MSPATLTMPRMAPGHDDEAMRLWPAPPVPGATLAQAMDSLWDQLVAHAPIGCPVCAAEMRPQYAAGAGVVGGRCTACASTLG